MAFGAILVMIVFFFMIFGGTNDKKGPGKSSIRSGQASRPISKDSILIPEATTVTVKDHRAADKTQDHNDKTNESDEEKGEVGETKKKRDVPLLLDEDAILAKAESHFEKAIAEQLISNQNRISRDVAQMINDIREQLEAYKGKQMGRQVLDHEDIEDLGNLVEDELREKIRDEIDERCAAMLKDKTEDMETAADIDEEAEAEGDEDPIDLTDTENKLVIELKKGVDDIVAQVRNAVPSLGAPILKYRIEATLMEKYKKWGFEAVVQVVDSDGDDRRKTIVFKGWQRVDRPAPEVTADAPEAEEKEEEALTAGEESTLTEETSTVETKEDDKEEDSTTDSTTSDSTSEANEEEEKANSETTTDESTTEEVDEEIKTETSEATTSEEKTGSESDTSSKGKEEKMEETSSSSGNEDEIAKLEEEIKELKESKEIKEVEKGEDEMAAEATTTEESSSRADEEKREKEAEDVEEAGRTR